MKTTSSFNHLFCISLFSSILFFACKKESVETELSPEQEQETSAAIAQSEMESEIIFNDVFDNVIGASNEVGLEGTGIFGRLSTNQSTNETARITGCYNVTVTHTVQGQIFPLRIEIDFGAGCKGRDGRTRSGKIISSYTGRLMIPGKSSTTTFENYKVDSISVEGSYTIRNTGSANTRQFSIEVTGVKLTKPNGSSSVRSSHRVITQTEGLGTPELHIDDIFTITGHSSGELTTQIFATVWESNIIEPLIKNFTCPWIAKGKVKVSRKNLAASSGWAAILDYGDGQCDKKAILTINGKDRQITLH